MKKYKITKETILKYQMKDEFPEAFEEPSTGWYKTTGNGNEKWIGCFENDIFKHGIGADGKWFENKSGYHNFKINDSYYEATPQEVETALINEAKKRGLADGLYCLSPNRGYKRVLKYPLKLDKGILVDDNHNYVFDSGIFAKPIETITIQEAEKLLNKKIVGQ